MEQTKVPLREKVAFTITNVGNIPVMTLVSSFLSIFYVTVLGMDEFKVGTMFLVARIFDGVNDPVIGFLMDRKKDSKFGKFRKTLKKLSSRNLEYMNPCRNYCPVRILPQRNGFTNSMTMKFR